MNEHPSPDLRIGDTERHEAIEALGEHVGAGRLTVDEYGERSAMVTTAKTRRDLIALFVDLPDPRPSFAVAVPPPPSSAVPVTRPSPRAWLSPALVPVVGALVVALYLLVKNPLVLLLVPAAVLLLSSARGRRR
ncbi:DUF1707 SHOCT-like domain-containing protein [Umezawaea beigongshangensis]|uniref:DUF1707 SHOCT-like domain-containing protein n=1 Tax=Umezawaea beigongshangensis TaxID=2780383 RepID=UPI0018F1C836|nr:DUF1707 domain-containing protein [Umezawaea beigongshangensis]